MPSHTLLSCSIYQFMCGSYYSTWNGLLMLQNGLRRGGEVALLSILL